MNIINVICFQIQLQFPISFEFNLYLLKFLAYHHVSNRFRTFMLDNEQERMEAGWFLEESQRHKQVFSSGYTSPGTNASSHSSHYSNGFPSYSHFSGSSQSPGGVSSPPSHHRHMHHHHQQASEDPEKPPIPVGISVWDYIRAMHRQSSVFYNFVYSPSETESVLRPYSNISNLKLWDYYLEEDLAHGPPYDLEVIEMEESREVEEALIDGPISPSMRKVVNGCYDNTDRLLPNACHYLMQVGYNSS